MLKYKNKSKCLNGRIEFLVSIIVTTLSICILPDCIRNHHVEFDNANMSKLTITAIRHGRTHARMERP